MYRVELKDVSGQLPHLLESALDGEEVIITEGERPVLRLARVPEDGAKHPAAPSRRRPGSARGQIRMADDFDAPLEDFLPYTS